MKLLVIGAGMMGSAAAFDMARSHGVEFVTLADADTERAQEAAKFIAKAHGNDEMQLARIGFALISVITKAGQFGV